jgi:hypothetical protein
MSQPTTLPHAPTNFYNVPKSKYRPSKDLEKFITMIYKSILQHLWNHNVLLTVSVTYIKGHVSNKAADFILNYVSFFFFLIRIVGGGAHIGCPRGTAVLYWPIVPVPGECEDIELGGMKWGWQGKPKYSEKICPGVILPTTNPTCQTRARTRTAAVGSQRLTA